MAEPSIPSVDIQNVEAEITGAARDAQRVAQRGSAPSPEDLVRLMREAMAQETWRCARLSAD